VGRGGEEGGDGTERGPRTQHTNILFHGSSGCSAPIQRVNLNNTTSKSTVKMTVFSNVKLSTLSSSFLKEEYIIYIECCASRYILLIMVHMFVGLGKITAFKIYNL